MLLTTDVMAASLQFFVKGLKKYYFHVILKVWGRKQFNVMPFKEAFRKRTMQRMDG